MTADAAGAAQSRAKIFISYSRKDMVFADRLEAALKTRGFEPLIDRTDIYAFEDWWKRIEALIARADTVVFVLSPDSAASDVARKEVAFAASMNKRFAPILLRPVNGIQIPEAVAKLNFVFFDDDAQFEASADRLAEALDTDITWVRQHTTFGEQARHWALAKGPRGLLLRSPVLEQAERWIAARPHGAPAPTEETQVFIRASRQDTTRRRNVLTSSLAAGLVLALGLAGLAYWQRGLAVEQRDKATHNFKLAQRTAESLVIDIARGMRNVQGMGAETVRRILDTARATFEQLAAAAPDDLALQGSQSVLLDELGETYQTLGDLDAALRASRDSLAIRERLVAVDPSNPLWQAALSQSHTRVGEVLIRQGQLERALKSYRDGLDIMERLAAANPSNTVLQRELTVSYDRVGNVLMRQGQLEEALKAYRNNVPITKRLVAADPSNPQWQSDLSWSYVRVGQILVRQGKLEEALKSYRDGLAIMERLAAADRSNTVWPRTLAIWYDRVGSVLLAQGQIEDAFKSYRDSLAIMERLIAGDPSNADWQSDLSLLYVTVGDVLVQQGKLEEAVKTYRDSLAIQERLAAAHRGHAEWQRDLSISYNKVGDILLQQGQLKEALKSYRDSLAIRERLATADPSNLQWQSDLQIAIVKVGSLAYNFVLNGNFAIALECADQAISLTPAQIWLYTNRAHALMFLGRDDEAKAVYLRYRGEQRVALDKSWETIILGDFAELRRAKLTHPLMDEIEALFASRH